MDDSLFEARPGDYDFQCGLMSLPGLLGMRMFADVPNLFRQWQADLNRQTHWRAAGMTSFRVGICWRAEEHGTPRPHRSIPTKLLESLARAKGTQAVLWISLCPSGLNLHRELEPEPSPAWMREPPVDLSTWDDTAALIAALDLVVTVDTSVAHLAGALGVPTWLLLSLRGDWKWPPTENGRTPWYPSVRIFRQQRPEKWNSVVLAVRDELRREVRRRKKA